MESCGFSFWQPRWLQGFGKIRWYIFVYASLGIIQSAGTTYFNITLTTIEKRFRIPSQTTGFLLSGNEISQILFSLILTYFGGQKSIPKWLSLGAIASAFSCFILALPHLIYGAGDEALQNTQEYVSGFNNTSTEILSNPMNFNNNNNKLCQNSTNIIDDCDEEFSYVPLYLIFMSQFILGIGNTLFYSLGLSYIDDNTHQHKSPLLLSYVYAMRIFGPTIGYGFAYVLLKIYIAPTLTPIFANDDPRWIGAWWLGWLVIGTIMLVFAFLIGLFPKKIQREKLSGEQKLDTEKYDKNIEHIKKQSTEALEHGSLKHFPRALWRLMTNKLLMLNSCNAVFHVLGFAGSVIYMGKMLEVQFNKTAAGGSIIIGPPVMIGMAMGMILSGAFISKFKPRASRLFAYNIIVASILLLATISYSGMGCENSNPMEVNGTIFACNSNCACDGISFTPVCDHLTTTTYFSPCHAGCKSFDEKLKIYTDCVCPDEPADEMQVERFVTPGACAGECDFDFYLYSFIFMISNTVSATGLVINVLVPFRAVAPHDKSMSQGLSLFITSLFAFIPGPIFFGRIIDSTCLIWKNKCGREGNCLLYDPVKFRYHLHISSAGFISIAVLFDILIWYYGRDLDLYGDLNDKQLNVIEKKKEVNDSHENQPLHITMNQ